MLINNNEVKIAAAIILYENASWKIFMDALSKIADEIYLKIDMSKSSNDFIAKLKSYDKVKSVEEFSNFKYIVYKEIVLRMLDNVKPDLAILLDHDEVFEDGIFTEIIDFYNSNKLGMMFTYNPCVSRDGSILPVYPPAPHMKVFKWREGLSFIPYMSQDRVTQYVDESAQWNSKTKINHYCMYTPEMEKAKKEEILKLYNLKLVNNRYE